MNSCEHYQELISRMADGDLSAGEERELSAHLQSCSDCAALYQAFSLLSHKLGEELEEPPLDLRDNVMAEIRREEIRRRNRLPNILRAVFSAAACVAVIVGVYMGVSLTRGSHLSTAAFQSEAAVVEEKVAVPEVAAADAAVPRAAAAEMPAAEPETTAEEPRLFADAAAPAAVKEPDEAAEANGAVPEEMKPEADAAEDPEALAEEESAPEEEDVFEAEPVPEREVTDWELRGWSLSLLRSLLGGSPAELEPEELEGCLLYRLTLTTEKESLEVLVYERGGTLYYLDPAEELLYRADLTPEELELFLQG